MMKTLRIFFILVFPTFLFGQSVNPKNAYFNDISVIPCPFDESGNTMISTATGWQAYQTLNDRWDGVVDSTRCISIQSSSHAFISPSELDIDKPVFIRQTMEEADWHSLMPNTIYNMGNYFETSLVVKNTADCENGICTGTIVGVKIPNEAGDSLINRTVPIVNNFDNGGFWQVNGCFGSEKFEEQLLFEYIIKITFEPGQSPFSQSLELHNCTGQRNDVTDEVSEINIGGFDCIPDEQCNVQLQYLLNLQADFGNYLMVHADNTYPSADNIYFIDVNYEGATENQQEINIEIEFDETLLFQPFTQVRGGLVDGSDSLRHQVNIINNGANFCFAFSAEFTIENETRYVHNEGEIELTSSTSCFRVQDNGKLIVGENAHLEYGKNGHGMLLLGSGGAIELRKNAALTIDNHLFIFDYEQQHSNLPQELNVYLEKGNTLTFGPNARISAPNPNDDFKLNVYMNGGVLDDRHLSEPSRQLIRKIYPTPAAQLADNVHVFPNPNDGQFEIAITTAAASSAQWSLWTMDGKQIAQGAAELAKGINYMPVLGEQSAIGLHYVRVEMEGEVVTKSVIVQ